MTSIDVTVLPARGSDGLIRTQAKPSIEDFKGRAPELAASIQDVARIIQSRLESPQPAGEWALDTINLSFQLALEAEAGVIIAKASTSATFSVDMCWKRPETPPGADASQPAAGT